MDWFPSGPEVFTGMTTDPTLWLISTGLAPQTPGITSFSPGLRQGVAIPEEAILRRVMIGSHAANEREIRRPINVRKRKKKSGS